MSKDTIIMCDRINYINATLSGDVVIQLENLDLRFLLDIEPKEILTNIDAYKVLDCMDIDELQEYMKERINA